MRLRRFVFALSALTLTMPGFTETVIDVHKEWEAHASSSAATSTAVSSNTANAENTETPADNPACECDTLTPQERLEQSTIAFTGRVMEARAAKNGKRVIVFEVDEIFKGSPELETKVTAEVAGTPCDLPYEEGQSYLVFAHWEWGTMITTRCMGTKFLEKAKVAALGPNEEMKEKLYVHLRNACMGRSDTSCCLSSLKAMRQGYYVPEPEAGCAEGSVPDRLSCGGSYTWCIPYAEKSHRPLDH